jgi:hypothetical protein
MIALARISISCKRQTRPLIREGALHQQARNSLTVTKNLVLGPAWGLTTRQTGLLTVGRNLTLIKLNALQSCD